MGCNSRTLVHCILQFWLAKQYVPLLYYFLHHSLTLLGVGVFQEYYQNSLLNGYSASTISWIPSLQFFLMMGMVRFSLLYALHLCTSFGTPNTVDATDMQILHTRMAHPIVTLANSSQGPFVGA